MLGKKIKVNKLIGPSYITGVIYISNINFIDHHTPKGGKINLPLRPNCFPNSFLFPNQNKNV